MAETLTFNRSAASRYHELGSISVDEGIDSPYPFPILLLQSRTKQLLAPVAAADTTIDTATGIQAAQTDCWARREGSEQAPLVRRFTAYK